jgi:sialic acid synthase SpsE
MDINQSIIKIKSALRQNKSIIILGRGESTNFFLKNKKNFNKKNFIIGFNTHEIFKEVDILLTNKKNLCTKLYSKKFLYTEDIYKKFVNKIEKIRIGKVFYSLDSVLYLINFLCIKKNYQKNIFFVGFDFRASIPDGDYKKVNRGNNVFQSLIDIASQREIFFRKKNNFSNLKILHAGFDINSDCDPRFLSFKKVNNYIKIVAEVTTNHFGNDQNIIELIHSAKKAGADYVKFSIRDVESFYPAKILKSKYKSPFGNTFYDYRKKLELNDKQITMIKKISHELNIVPFFSILDKISFLRLQKYNFEILKLPSTISVDKIFFKYISDNYFGEIVISTGMTNDNFLSYCANLFKKNKKLYMLHCISSYPTSTAFTNIKNIQLIKNLKKKYKNIIPGYSSHDLADEVCAMAIACGAKMIEKHIKLGTKKWAHFDQTALDARFEFPYFVQNIRNYEKILGTGKKQISKVENHKYFFRKN